MLFMDTNIKTIYVCFELENVCIEYLITENKIKWLLAISMQIFENKEFASD